MSRYSPISDTFFSNNGSNPGTQIPSIALSIPAVLPAATQNYPVPVSYSILSAFGPFYGSAGYSRILQEDRIYIKRFAVFCNFADGLLIDRTPGGDFDMSVLLRLEDSATSPPPPNSLTAMLLPFSTFNTWYPVEEFFPVSSPPPSGFFNLYGALEDFSFRPDSIGQEYNGELVNFRLAVDVDHTLPLTL